MEEEDTFSPSQLIIFKPHYASTNLKKFWLENLTSLLYLPIPLLAESWKMCQFFFSIKLTFQARKIHILESTFFAKIELIMWASIWVQDFMTGKNFSFNQCHLKRVLQALGFQITWITIFWFRAQRSWETNCNNFLVLWKFMGNHFYFF